MIAAILFIPLSLISLLLPVSAAQSCYYPNATLSTDTPCNTTKTGHSACCTAQCMTSGLCFDNGLISRGSCTDPDWKDSSCPQYCTDYFPGGGAAIIPHAFPKGVLDVADMGWCCGFPLANGSCPQGFEINVQAGTIIQNTTTRSSANNTVVSTVTASGNSTCNSDNNHDVAIGVGVGVPAVIAICSLLFLWVRERHRRRSEVPGAVLESNARYAGMKLMSTRDGSPNRPIIEIQPRGELP